MGKVLNALIRSDNRGSLSQTLLSEATQNPQRRTHRLYLLRQKRKAPLRKNDEHFLNCYYYTFIPQLKSFSSCHECGKV